MKNRRERHLADVEFAAAANARDRASRQALAAFSGGRVRGVPASDPAPAQKYNHRSEAYKDKKVPKSAIKEALSHERINGIKMK